MIQRFLGVSIGALVTFLILWFSTVTDPVDLMPWYVAAAVIGAIASFLWPVVAGIWLGRRAKARRDEIDPEGSRPSDGRAEQGLISIRRHPTGMDDRPGVPRGLAPARRPLRHSGVRARTYPAGCLGLGPMPPDVIVLLDPVRVVPTDGMEDVRDDRWASAGLADDPQRERHQHNDPDECVKVRHGRSLLHWQWRGQVLKVPRSRPRMTG